MITDNYIARLSAVESRVLIDRLAKHLAKIVKRKDAKERYIQLSAKMHIVTDAYFDNENRKYEGALCRWIIGYQMTCEGYSLSDIGKAMNRSHATIIAGNNRIREILNTSYYYPTECTLINKFSNEIL